LLFSSLLGLGPDPCSIGWSRRAAPSPVGPDLAVRRGRGRPPHAGDPNPGGGNLGEGVHFAGARMRKNRFSHENKHFQSLTGSGILFWYLKCPLSLGKELLGPRPILPRSPSPSLASPVSSTVRSVCLKNIFVGNLSFSSTEDAVRSIFEAHGTVDRVSIITDRETGKSRGFAFVEMPNDEEAARAIGALNGAEYGGRKLNVNEARPREERGAGGGGFSRAGGGAGGGGGFRRREPRW